MPHYGQPSKQVRLELPTAPDCHIWGPAELDYWDEIQVRSRASRTEVNPMTNQGLTIIDSAVFEYEMLHRWLEQSSVHWDLVNPDTNLPYEMDARTIDTLFKGENGQRDRNYIIQEIGVVLFPDVFPGEKKAESDEGNAQSQSSDHGEPAPETAGPLSSEPSSPSQHPTSTPESTDAPGSTRLPMEVPSPATP